MNENEMNNVKDHPYIHSIQFHPSIRNRGRRQVPGGVGERERELESSEEYIKSSSIACWLSSFLLAPLLPPIGFIMKTKKYLSICRGGADSIGNHSGAATE